jgi:hypothetical protein
MAHQMNLPVKAAVQSMRTPPGAAAAQSAPVVIDFLAHVSLLAGLLRRQGALVLKMGSKFPKYLEVRWDTLSAVLVYLVRKARHPDLVTYLASRSMSHTGSVTAESPVAWKKTWLLVFGLERITDLMYSTFMRFQRRDVTVAEAQGMYNELCSNVKAYINMGSVDASQAPPADSIIEGKYFVRKVALRAHLERIMLTSILCEELQALDTYDGGTAHTDSVFYAAGRFAMWLVIKIEANAAERGNTRLFEPVPNVTPLAMCGMISRELRLLTEAHKPRLVAKTGEQAATK